MSDIYNGPHSLGPRIDSGFSAGVTISIADLSSVHVAVSAAVSTAREVGLVERDVASVSLAATELATNLALHAWDGVLIVNGTRSGPVLQMLSIDNGPGIGNTAAALADGFSTAGTLGEGLGTCRRACDVFDMYSSDAGTVIVASVGGGSAPHRPAVPGAKDTGDSAPLLVGGLVTPHPQEKVSGDGWRAMIDPSGMTVAMADGLGHGPDAAAARRQALDAIESDVDPRDTVERAESRLRATRGAVIAVGRLDSTGGLHFAGLGNVAAVLVRRDGSMRSLLSKPGIAGSGSQHYRLDAQRDTLALGSMLVMHTDGVDGHWADEPLPTALANRHPAVVAGTIWRNSRRSIDDAAVCVVMVRE